MEAADFRGRSRYPKLHVAMSELCSGLREAGPLAASTSSEKRLGFSAWAECA